MTRPHREPLSRGNQGRFRSAFRCVSAPKLPSLDGSAFHGVPSDRPKPERRATHRGHHLAVRPRIRPRQTRGLAPSKATGRRWARQATSSPVRVAGDRADPPKGIVPIPCPVTARRRTNRNPLDARGVRIFDTASARRRAPHRPKRLDHPVKPNPGCTRDPTAHPRVQRESALCAESPDRAPHHPEGLLVTPSGSSFPRPTHQEPTPTTRPPKTEALAGMAPAPGSLRRARPDDPRPSTGPPPEGADPACRPHPREGAPVKGGTARGCSSRRSSMSGTAEKNSPASWPPDPRRDRVTAHGRRLGRHHPRRPDDLPAAEATGLPSIRGHASIEITWSARGQAMRATLSTHRRRTVERIGRGTSSPERHPRPVAEAARFGRASPDPSPAFLVGPVIIPAKEVARRNRSNGA